MSKPLILVTNDDGIESPGLAAAVTALEPLGELLIVAPLKQQTSMSRSRSQQGGQDGRLYRKTVQAGEKTWDGVAANATPALTVEHAVWEIATRPIDLVVSGINYGENVGSCVTVSGTIGAALEAAERGLPALAVSLELDVAEYHVYDTSINFDAAIHFTRFFAERMLKQAMPDDVDVIKLEVPAHATTEAEWMVARQDKFSYYKPNFGKREELFGEAGLEAKHIPSKGQYSDTDTDTYALAKGIVSITPLSLDLTSRVNLGDLQTLFE